MEAAGRRNVGFDPIEVEAWIGLEKAHAAPADLETCRRNPAPAQDPSASSISETNPS
jgi:hypothetical protein